MTFLKMMVTVLIRGFYRGDVFVYAKEEEEEFRGNLEIQLRWG
jgi:hypothetical protein